MQCVHDLTHHHCCTIQELDEQGSSLTLLDCHLKRIMNSTFATVAIREVANHEIALVFCASRIL